MSEATVPRPRPVTLGQFTARIVVALTVVAIFLLPFTSLPVMPSKYKPVSDLIFAPLGMAFLLMSLAGRKKVLNRDLLLLGYVASALLYSGILVAAGNLAMASFLRYAIVYLVGMFGYFGMLLGLRMSGPASVQAVLRSSLTFFTALGFFDIWCLYLHGPKSLMDEFDHLIAPDVLAGRITVTTEEAAWAAITGLCILITFIVTSQIKGKPYIYRAIALSLVVLAALSLDGVLVAGMTVGLYWMIIHMPRLTVRAVRNALIVIGCFMLMAYGAYSYIKANNVTAYYAARFTKLASLTDLSQVILLDQSVFIRLVYPYIGVEMAIDHPTGIGIGGYSQYFASYLSQQITASKLSAFTEVTNDLITKTADPKNLWACAASETGWLGMIVLLAFVLSHFAGDRRSPYWKHRVLLVAYALSLSQSFGSFAGEQFWFALALARTLEYPSWVTRDRPLWSSAAARLT